MKFKRFLTKDEKIHKLTNWHRYFTLFPKQVGGHIIWLEYVERKGSFYKHPWLQYRDDIQYCEISSTHWNWEYKEIEKSA